MDAKNFYQQQLSDNDEDDWDNYNSKPSPDRLEEQPSGTDDFFVKREAAPVKQERPNSSKGLASKKEEPPTESVFPAIAQPTNAFKPFIEENSEDEANDKAMEDFLANDLAQLNPLERKDSDEKQKEAEYQRQIEKDDLDFFQAFNPPAEPKEEEKVFDFFQPSSEPSEQKPDPVEPLPKQEPAEEINLLEAPSQPAEDKPQQQEQPVDLLDFDPPANPEPSKIEPQASFEPPKPSSLADPQDMREDVPDKDLSEPEVPKAKPAEESPFDHPVQVLYFGQPVCSVVQVLEMFPHQNPQKLLELSKQVGGDFETLVDAVIQLEEEQQSEVQAQALHEEESKEENIENASKPPEQFGSSLLDDFEDKDKEDDLLDDLVGFSEESMEYQKHLEAQIRRENKAKSDYMLGAQKANDLHLKEQRSFTMSKEAQSQSDQELAKRLYMEQMKEEDEDERKTQELIMKLQQEEIQAAQRASSQAQRQSQRQSQPARRQAPPSDDEYYDSEDSEGLQRVAHGQAVGGGGAISGHHPLQGQPVEMSEQEMEVYRQMMMGMDSRQQAQSEEEYIRMQMAMFEKMEAEEKKKQSAKKSEKKEESLADKFVNFFKSKFKD